MRYKGIPLLPLVVAATAAAVFVKYRSSIQAARARLRGKSTVIPSPYGDIEYTEHGIGPDVLVIHGSGGGFDQGELLAQVVLDDQFHRITPRALAMYGRRSTRELRGTSRPMPTQACSTI